MVLFIDQLVLDGSVYRSVCPKVVLFIESVGHKVVLFIDQLFIDQS